MHILRNRENDGKTGTPKTRLRAEPLTEKHLRFEEPRHEDACGELTPNHERNMAEWKSPLGKRMGRCIRALFSFHDPVMAFAVLLESKGTDRLLEKISVFEKLDGLRKTCENAVWSFKHVNERTEFVAINMWSFCSQSQTEVPVVMRLKYLERISAGLDRLDQGIKERITLYPSIEEIKDSLKPK